MPALGPADVAVLGRGDDVEGALGALVVLHRLRELLPALKTANYIYIYIYIYIRVV